MNAASQTNPATDKGLRAVQPSELPTVGGGLSLLDPQGGGPFDGIIFINRGGWTCGTFDPRHGLPGSPAPQVPNY
jgi:hypothetical protein